MATQRHALTTKIAKYRGIVGIAWIDAVLGSVWAYFLGLNNKPTTAPTINGPAPRMTGTTANRSIPLGCEKNSVASTPVTAMPATISKLQTAIARV